jgi:thiol:disulfide interchange protein
LLRVTKTLCLAGNRISSGALKLEQVFATAQERFGMALRYIIVIALLLYFGRTGATADSAAVPQNAFSLIAQYDDEQFVLLRWAIAPGHHITQGTIAATLNGRRLNLAAPTVPLEKGFVGRGVYAGPLLTAIVLDDIPAHGEMLVTYQGCSRDHMQCRILTHQVDLSTLAVSGSWPEIH